MHVSATTIVDQPIIVQILIALNSMMSFYDEVYNKVEVFNLMDEATVKYNNFEPLFIFEDPYRFQMYDVPCAQLKDVHWYSQ